MNEVDLERHRLNSRIATTWFVVLIGLSVCMYFIMVAFESVTDFSIKIIFASVIAILVADKLNPYIRKFYEKRLMNSKKRSHTT